MTKKILFMDLDGTLLNDQKEITEGNYKALHGALERGHRVVITSGRPLKSTKIQAKKLGLDGAGCYLIAFNGAVVYDCGAEQVIFQETVPKEYIYAVFDEANRRGIHIQTFDDVDVLVEPRCDDDEIRIYCGRINMEYRVIDSVRTGLEEAPVKALAIDLEDHDHVKGLEDWLLKEMKGKVDCFFSSRQYLEVVPVNMNKGTAIVAMCQRLGIPVADSIAVGDEANDISMIEAAGIGVAMANGVPAVHAVADYITKRDNNHDGIAEVVETFLA